jgi:glutamate/leucine/phenylalanine/valine dehydrogenase
MRLKMLASRIVSRSRVSSNEKGCQQPSQHGFRPAQLSPRFLKFGQIIPWATYLAQIDRVIPYLGDLTRWAETLKHPKRTLIVDVPIEMDNGMVRVQHNLSRGPGKGGVRFHPSVTLEETMALAAWMTCLLEALRTVFGWTR